MYKRNKSVVGFLLCILFLLQQLAGVSSTTVQEDANSNGGNRCFWNVTLGTNENSLIHEIKESILRMESFENNCLNILVERGFFKAAVVLLEEYFLTNGIDLHESTMRLTQSQKKELDRFISNVWSANQAVQQIEPVIKWAQSQSHVFIHIKFSMRQDSPACVHCKIERVEITNSTLFTSSFGIQSHQPLRFLLNLTLFDQINPSSSIWTEDSVGTLFFNLTKSNRTTFVSPSSQPIFVDEQIESQDKNTTPIIDEAIHSTDQQGLTKETVESTEPQDTTTQTQTQVKDEPKEVEEKESSPTKIWLRLEKDERKKDIAIWWDMRDRYSADMNEWDKLCKKERENKKKRTKQIKEDL